ncbi:Kinase [Hexamita inflata]|uniref:Kinase n=1 Tax=Hexamita inflata TaxID=28002 RepID=A0AA86PVD7_9EUKA|nr:Kinase [Hexamita inflata]
MSNFISKLSCDCCKQFGEQVQLLPVDNTHIEIRFQPIMVPNPHHVSLKIQTVPVNPTVAVIKQGCVPGAQLDFLRQKLQTMIADSENPQFVPEIMSIFNQFVSNIKEAEPLRDNASVMTPGMRISVALQQTDTNATNRSAFYHENSFTLKQISKTDPEIQSFLNQLSNEHKNDLLINNYLIQYLLAHQQIKTGEEEYEKLQTELLSNKLIEFRIPYSAFRYKTEMQRYLNDYDLTKEQIQMLSKPVQQIFSNKFKYFAERFTNPIFLGKGGFGEVCLCTSKTDNKEYAVKKVALPDDDRTVNNILQEIRTLIKLQSQFVVQYYNAWTEAEAIVAQECTDYFNNVQDVTFNNNNKNQNQIEEHNANFDDFKSKTEYVYEEVYEEEMEETQQEQEEVLPLESTSTIKTRKSELGQISAPSSSISNVPMNKVLFIQMEYCKGQTLNNLIYSKQELHTDTKWKITIQLISGIAYIHKQNIVHRDIKPDNIFLTESNDIKYGDFGISLNFSTEQCKNIAGTKQYMAPEMVFSQLSQKEFQKCDIYALGLTLFELWVLKTTEHRTTYFYQLKNSIAQKDQACSIFEDFRSDQPDIYNVIRKMCEPDPEERYSIAQLMAYPAIFAKMNVKQYIEQIKDEIDTVQKEQIVKTIIDSTVLQKPAPTLLQNDFFKITDLCNILVQQFTQLGFDLQYIQNLLTYTTSLRSVSTFLNQLKMVGMDKRIQINCEYLPILNYIHFGIEKPAVYELLIRNEPCIGLVFQNSKLVEIMEFIVQKLKEKRNYCKITVFYQGKMQQVENINYKQAILKMWDGFQDYQFVVRAGFGKGVEEEYASGGCCNGITQLIVRPICYVDL